MYVADIQQILLYEGMIQPTVVMEVGHVQTQLLGVNPGGLSLEYSEDWTCTPKCADYIYFITWFLFPPHFQVLFLLLPTLT